MRKLTVLLQISLFTKTIYIVHFSRFFYENEKVIGNNTLKNVQSYRQTNSKQNLTLETTK